jgi:type I restriction enzyme, S subunit
VHETKEKVSELGLANSSARLLPAGTVILSRTASVGYSAVLGKPMATTQDFANWICGEKLRSEYLLAAFRAMKSEFSRMMMGSTHKTIYMPDIAELYCAIPPMREQSQIVAFLDHEIARIDALVEEQQRLIELLMEKRKAVISHAVTKGLDPNVPMKDSGVEWLGEVPEHWDLKSLMHLTPPDRKIMYGIVLPGPDFDGGVPIIKGGDVKPGRLALDKLCRTDPKIEAKYERSRVACGDIVYSIRGGIGDAEIVPEEVAGSNLTQDAARVSPRDGVCNTWLLYALKSGPIFSQLEAKATGATIRGINIMDLKRAVIPVPPLEEQQQIAEKLGFIIGKLDRLEKEAGAAITLMQEHRSALISAAVTGKIDVRGWQPPEVSSAHVEAVQMEGV